MDNSTPAHALDSIQALEREGSNHLGLSQAEVSRRLAAEGLNQIREEKRAGMWSLFLGQFKSLIVWILLVAGSVSGFLGEGADAIAIFTIVILNAAIGFYQEYDAEKAIAALRGMTAPQAKVRREGKVLIIPTAQIVRGDLIEFETGDLVPADARLLEASELRCAEAALTGESEPVKKSTPAIPQIDLPLGDRRNMVYLGTNVVAGHGMAVVTATGMRTEIGHIAGLLETAGEAGSTPLQKRLENFSRILVWSCLAVVAILFVLGLLRKTPFFEMFLTSVSLAVAAVPEGLPAVVTIALALGVQRMAKRRALIRRLPAVETLGSAEVICTDKTGTLTVGEMTVRELYLAGTTFDVQGAGLEPLGQIRPQGNGFNGDGETALRHMAGIQVSPVTANLFQEGGRWKVAGDPTEGALLAAAAKAGVTREILDEFPKIHEYPFDSDRKRASVIRCLPDGHCRLSMNGAPDVLLGLCTQLYTPSGVVALSESDRNEILRANDAMAGKALRVIGSAYRDFTSLPGERPEAADVERDLVFVGLAGMQDPPRLEAKKAVALCRDAGIRVVMITGDHPATALAVARELGLAGVNDVAVTGADLDRMDKAELDRRVNSIAVYARVTAEHKLRIVKAWKATGSVTAMTGDGVNDAPALKGADIGVAMGISGTEVTKQSSDMVIADDNFASIVAAVEEGRGIYDNIRKTLVYLLTGNSGELLLMTAAVAVGYPSPLLPVQLLWINLVTDGLPALCLAADPVEKGVMQRAPRPRKERLANGSFLQIVMLGGALTAGVSLTAFWLGWKTGGVEMGRAYAFGSLVYCELFRAFGSRSETLPVWRIPFGGNKKLLAVIVVSLGLQSIILHGGALGQLLRTSRLTGAEIFGLMAVGILPSLVLEAVKVFRMRGIRPGFRGKL